MGIEKLEALTKQIEDARAAAREQGKVIFAEACAEMFEKHPDLQYFSWTQYAPYFNDGEPCEFSVRDVDQIQVGETTYGEIWTGKKIYGYVLDENGEETEEDIPNTPEILAIFDSIDPIMRFLMANEDIAETAFGNHVRVTAYRDGTVLAEDHEHD